MQYTFLKTSSPSQLLSHIVCVQQTHTTTFSRRNDHTFLLELKQLQLKQTNLLLFVSVCHPIDFVLILAFYKAPENTVSNLMYSL